MRAHSRVAGRWRFRKILKIGTRAGGPSWDPLHRPWGVCWPGRGAFVGARVPFQKCRLGQIGSLTFLKGLDAGTGPPPRAFCYRRNKRHHNAPHSRPAACLHVRFGKCACQCTGRRDTDNTRQLSRTMKHAPLSTMSHGGEKWRCGIGYARNVNMLHNGLGICNSLKRSACGSNRPVFQTLMLNG